MDILLPIKDAGKYTYRKTKEIYTKTKDGIR
jgi:hypothetical protein